MKGWSFGALVAALKDAAFKDTGTTSGTVAAGDDSRIVNALQKGNNLSDVSNADTSRNNLGLGTAQDVTHRNVRVSESLKIGTTGANLDQNIWSIGGSGTTNRQLWFRDEAQAELGVFYFNPSSQNLRLRIKNAFTWDFFGDDGRMNTPGALNVAGDVTAPNFRVTNSSARLSSNSLTVGDSTSTTPSLNLVNTDGSELASISQTTADGSELTFRVRGASASRMFLNSAGRLSVNSLAANGASSFGSRVDVTGSVYAGGGFVATLDVVANRNVYVGDQTQATTTRITGTQVRVGDSSTGNRSLLFTDGSGTEIAQMWMTPSAQVCSFRVRASSNSYSYNANGDFTAPGQIKSSRLSVSGDGDINALTANGLTVSQNTTTQTLTALSSLQVGRNLSSDEAAAGIVQTNLTPLVLTIGAATFTSNRQIVMRDNTGAAMVEMFQGISSDIFNLRVRGTAVYQFNKSGELKGTAFKATNTVTANNYVGVGTDAQISADTHAILGNNGDIRGTVWGGQLASYLNNKFAEVGSQLNGSGWWKDNQTGFIIQWGSGSNSSSNQTLYNFPIPFPHSHFSSATCMGVDVNNGNTVYMQVANNSQFYIKTSGSNMGYTWIAIGY